MQQINGYGIMFAHINRFGPIKNFVFFISEFFDNVKNIKKYFQVNTIQ